MFSSCLASRQQNFLKNFEKSVSLSVTSLSQDLNMSTQPLLFCCPVLVVYFCIASFNRLFCVLSQDRLAFKKLNGGATSSAWGERKGTQGAAEQSSFSCEQHPRHSTPLEQQRALLAAAAAAQ